MLKNRLRRLAWKFGYDLHIFTRPVTDFDRLVDGRISTLIDIGVGQGTPWLYGKFSDAYLFMIDPLEECRPHMEATLRRRRGGFVISAVGRERQELELTVQMDALTRSSLLERTSLAQVAGDARTRTVPVERLDDLVARHGLAAPFGIKIDTEGFELEVLKGAQETLRQSRFVITEASVSERFKGSYRFDELVCAMADLGFRVRNFLDYHIDRSGVVRSVDVLFVPLD